MKSITYKFLQLRKQIIQIPFLALLVMLLLLTGCLSKKNSQTNKSGYDLYLLVGQSNMVGVGKIEAEDTSEHPRVFVLDETDEFVLAKDPLPFKRKTKGVGPGLTFGKIMAEANPKVKIGLIPGAVGGTKISYWTPDNPRGLYQEAIRKAKVAMQKGELKGIIWQQGESDSNMKDAPLYKERLLKLLTTFRKDLGDDKLPIVIGGVGDFLKSSQYKVVNKAMQEVADEIGNARFSEASTLGDIGDKLHFNSAAQRENGKNMATAMLKIKK
ncbi:sialate O-acetylesterase [Pseudopedobacter beijingensis]|uniref:Sialate O-acetylesterase n=1 Tax=Pseudopedobacter beijingensis TaxID=1207056 RepID=A0ABW4I6G8_9SPHI